jgi:hypothetical protein
MKKIVGLCLLAIGALAFGCSSENKQDEMRDSSMAVDTSFMDMDSTNVVDTSQMDSLQRDRSVNADSVRQ